jgi:ubiquinone/menaquinone biosynthesis C-methylase UbiE
VDSFKDLFSKQSRVYSLSRPTYPQALFDFLASLPERRELAWDCATGNGQAAVRLADYFDKVVASDASKTQVENAQQKSNVRYAVFPAEKTDIADGTVDLITVAQALHWFDLDSFYNEARRVARKGAAMAAWMYGLHSISPEIDRITYRLYRDVLGKYWPAEIKHVENAYSDMPFPFAQIESPGFTIELEWDLADMAAYLYSWSSVQRYMEEQKRDPVETLHPDFAAAWGDPATKKVTWQVHVKAGRIK